MTNFKSIREHLGMTQAAIGSELGVTQGNISFYEKGQTIPPDVARQIIEVAKRRGLELSFDHIYGDAELPTAPAPSTHTLERLAARDAA